MKLSLAYGKTGLEFELPDSLRADVLRPKHADPPADPIEAVRAALRDPVGCEGLSQQVRPEDRVGIVINDITRPTPYPVILPALLRLPRIGSRWRH